MRRGPINLNNSGLYIMQVCTPAGLNLALLSTNFYSLGAATLVFKYKVWITKYLHRKHRIISPSSTCSILWVQHWWWWATSLSAGNLFSVQMISGWKDQRNFLVQLTFCFSSSEGSSSGSGDTEVCSEPGSCEMELDLPLQECPPYYNRSGLHLHRPGFSRASLEYSKWNRDLYRFWKS